MTLRSYLGVALSWAALFTSASAQQAVVLPPRLEPELTEPQAQALDASLRAALQAEGIAPVTAPQAGPDPCDDPHCVAEQLVRAGASHGARLTVWRDPAGAPSGVSVTLLGADGVHYSEGVTLLQAGALDVAIGQAVAGAVARLRRGPGPWLEVAGTPEGAVVSIDGKPSGRLPARIRVRGGLHHVSIEEPGYTSHDTSVTVARNPDVLERIEVALQPAAVAAASPTAAHYQDAPERRASVWNYVIAAAAVGAGAALAIGPTRTALDDGECGRRQDGRCTGVVELDTASALQLGAAAALVVGGVTFAIVAPLEIELAPEAASLRLHARF